MSTEKMREEFEAAFKKEFGFDWAETTPITDDGDATVMQVALWAWQASRAALTVEAPYVSDALNTEHMFVQGYLEGLKDFRVQVEAAGVKVKP
jgi:hypothetical protein